MVSSAEKKSLLKNIAQEVRTCDRCPLAQRRLNAVPGSGGIKTGIVFVGEGPGAKEDKLGEPFVGAAGKFLDEMLAHVGMKRSDVFVTNIVKCRPPNNRDPYPEEVKICTENFLWKQFEIIDPKIIFTLGRHAMHRFLPEDKKISIVHGQLFHITSNKTGKVIHVVPLYHPAAALYNGSMRDVLKSDFSMIPVLLKKVDEWKKKLNK